MQSNFGVAEVALRFPLIAGSIFGSASTGDILVEQARPGALIELSVERLRNAGARWASPVEPHVSDAGLVVQPKGARFARIGTFVADSRMNKTVGYGSFIDPRTRNVLILVYFDEPVRISGLLRVGTLEAEHNISIHSSGLYWIRTKELGNNRYELDKADVTGSVILGIEPLPLPKPGQGT